jgi:hypothetical protein
VTPGGTGDRVSAEAFEAALRVRQRAMDEMLTADALAGLTISAAKGSDMTPPEIRRLAASAIDQAQQISYLLGRLAGLLDDPCQEEAP